MWKLCPQVFLVCGLLSVLALGLGCSDEPTSVGVGLLPPSDLVNIDSLTATSATSSSFRTYINNGRSGSNLLVGKFQGYESKLLIKFSSIPDTLRTATALSTTVVLKPRYTFGDSLGTVSFEVHKMLQSWSESGVTWDSIPASSYDPAVQGMFTGVVADSDSVAVNLSPSLVQSWFQAVADTQPIQGIILIPTNSSSTVRGFSSFQSFINVPKLQVSFTKGGVQNSFTLSLGEDASISNIDNLVTRTDLMYVQAGVSYRASVKFDVSKIPKNSVVHNALLELTIDRTSSRLNKQTIDSLLAQFQTDSIAHAFEPQSVLGSRKNPQEQPDVYSFTITADVQRWVNNGQNNGIVLRAFGEVDNLDLFTFYSPLAVNETLRPRLKVLYSVPK